MKKRKKKYHKRIRRENGELWKKRKKNAIQNTLLAFSVKLFTQRRKIGFPLPSSSFNICGFLFQRNFNLCLVSSYCCVVSVLFVPTRLSQEAILLQTQN